MGAACCSPRLHPAGIFSLSVNGVRLQVLQAFAMRTRVNLVARQLGVSQPAVSLATRDIESAAGFPVFDRNVSGVGLTPAGETLLLHVKRALAELRVAEAELAAMKGRLEGLVTVGTLPFARPYMLPVAVSRLLKEHPGLRVSTVEGPFETLVSGLLSGDLDFVIGVLRPVEPASGAGARGALRAGHVGVRARGPPARVTAAAVAGGRGP